MKRLLSAILLLAATAMQAVAEDWPLKIAGIQVTDDNYKDVQGDVIKAMDPEFEYKVEAFQEIDNDNGLTIFTVTLTNALIDAGDENGIETESGDYILNIISATAPSQDNGGSKLTSNGYGVKGYRVNFSGAPLYVESASTTLPAIYATSEVNIFSKLTVKGAADALTGDGTTKLKLSEAASLTAEAGSSNYAISRFGSVSNSVKGNSDVNFTKMTGELADLCYTACDDKSNPVSTAHVGYKVYPLKVGQVEVTELNLDAISGTGITADKPLACSYDLDSNTFTLRFLSDATIADYYGFNFTGDENLVIDLCGYNVTVNAGFIGLYASSDESTVKIVNSGDPALLTINAAIGISVFGGLEFGATSRVLVNAEFDGIASQSKKTDKGLVLNRGCLLKVCAANMPLYGFPSAVYRDGDTDYAGNDAATVSDLVSSIWLYDYGTGDGFSASAYGTVYDKSVYKQGDLLIGRRLATIAGQQFSTYDFFDNGGSGLAASSAITGSIYLDSDGTMTMDDATITATDAKAPVGILADKYLKKLVLKGTNRIVAQETGIKLEDGSQLSIENGSDDKAELYIDATMTDDDYDDETVGDGISMGEARLSLNNGKDDLYIEIDADCAAIIGNGLSEIESTVEEGSSNTNVLKLRGTYNIGGALSGMKSITMEGLNFFPYPGTRVATDDTYGTFLTNYYNNYGQPTVDWVEVRQAEEFFTIGDVKVTELNAGKSIMSDKVQGFVFFDQDSKTLYLNGVTVDATYDEGGNSLDIMNGVITLDVTGTNKFAGSINLNPSESGIVVKGGGSIDSGEGFVNVEYGVNTSFNNITVNSPIDVKPTGSATFNNCKLNTDAIFNSGTSTFINCTVNTEGLQINDESTMNFNGSNVYVNGMITDAIFNDNGNLSIDNCYFEASTTSKDGYAYMGDGEKSTLYIKNSTVKLQGVSGTAAGYNLSLDGDVELTSPTNSEVVVLDEKTKKFEIRVKDSDDQLTGEWAIIDVPAEKKKYNIYIGKTQVTGMNKDNITGPEIEELSMFYPAQVSYDPVNRVLKLKDAHITDGLKLSDDVRTLELVNDNVITSGTEKTAIEANSVLTITSTDGNGSLGILDGGFATGIRLLGDLTISNCRVDIDVLEVGLSGMGSTLSVLDNARVTVSGGTSDYDGPIKGFNGGLTTNGYIGIDSPAGAAFNLENGWIAVGGVETKERVVIEPVFPLYVGETQVTFSNCSDIKDFALKDGKVSFDPKTDTLTIANATLNGAGIRTTTGMSLNVKFVGENAIKNANDGLSIDGTLSLTAADDKATLSVSATQYGLFAKEINIENCQATVDAGMAAVTTKLAGDVNISNSKLKLSCDDSQGAMSYISGLSLNGARISSPAGAVFDEEKKAVVLDDTPVKKLEIDNLLPGDVNNDGTVNITDVTMTISHILGQKPSGFNATAADVNSDSMVNITDVTTIIDMILKSK